MLSAFRNFAITFLISVLIFGLIAWVIVGNIVMPALTGSLSSETETDDAIYIPGTSGNAPDGLYYPVTPDGSSDGTAQLPDIEDSSISGSSFNFLIIGSDYQPELFDDYNYEAEWLANPDNVGFPDKSDRVWGADTILLVRVDKENREFVFCSIPRNTRISVGSEYMQLGEVFSSRSIEFFLGKVRELTGLEVDYYAHITVGSIANIVDAVGGVTYYVPEDMVYSDPVQNLEINLKKGTLTNMSGAQAAQLLRYAGYENGNAGRMNTAVEFVKAVLAKFTNVTYLAKAENLFNQVRNNIQTNFTVDALTSNLDLIFSYPKFQAVTVNYPGTTRASGGVEYFEPTTATAREMLSGSY